MKRLLLLNFLFLLLIGCASTNLDYGSSDSDKKYKEGLKYSIKSYSQSIDILADDSVQVSLENSNKNLSKSDFKLLNNTINNFRVQIASFQNEMNAKNYLAEVENKNRKFKFYVVQYNNFWRVLSGNFNNRYESENLLSQLKKNGFPDAWIIQF